ncbi:MAG: transposase DNA-binding-containing protein [Oligoflexus sp.]
MLRLMDEFTGCDFGDNRIRKRVISLANKFSENPRICAR